MEELEASAGEAPVEDEEPEVDDDEDEGEFEDEDEDPDGAEFVPDDHAEESPGPPLPPGAD
jgi:hypothetical protein